MMKKLIIFIAAISGACFVANAQTQIDQSEIYFDNQRNIVFKNNGSLLEPYGGFLGQQNSTLQINGKTGVSYGFPVFSFVKRSSFPIVGLLNFIDPTFGVDKRTAQLSVQLNAQKDGGQFHFSTRRNNSSQGQFNNMVFDEEGKLGIGTTTPEKGLHIVSNASGTVKSVIKSTNTNVRGVASMQVWNNSDSFLQMVNWGSSFNGVSMGESRAGNGMLEYYGTGNLFLGSRGNSDIGLISNSQRRITIKGNGYVGIGTETPSNPLTVRGNQGRTFVIERESAVYGNIKGSMGISGNTSQGGLRFQVSPDNGQNWNDAMFLQAGGRVGIGTPNPSSKLTVAGNIHSQEIKVTVDAGTGPDYVFEEDYELKSLEEIKSYIDLNKHLPEVPSARIMESDGVNLGDMNMLLLKKVEELTLYLIEQNKQNQNQQARIELLEKELKSIKND